MIRSVLVVVAGLAVALSGCQRAGEGVPSGVGGGKGRYVGVGIYTPGDLWAQLARPKPTQPLEPSAATLADDDHIVVVLDSATGELRQCGNLSGHCIALNPWSKTASSQGAPAALLKHAQDLKAEAADVTLKVQK